MRWSKLKKEIEARFAESIQGKIHLYSTRYSASTIGRGWITYRDSQLVNFETHLSGTNFGAYYHQVTQSGCLDHTAMDERARTPNGIIERGEFSQFDLHHACWALLQLSIEEALTSPNPLIQGLAFLDRRAGKKRIFAYSNENLHPFAQKMLEIRRYEELSE